MLYRPGRQQHPVRPLAPRRRRYRRQGPQRPKGSVVQAMASGASGRIIGSGLRGLNSARLQLFRLIRPLYRWVEKLGAFRWLAVCSAD